jgi:hypothetical protein
MKKDLIRGAEQILGNSRVANKKMRTKSVLVELINLIREQ